MTQKRRTRPHVAIEQGPAFVNPALTYWKSANKQQQVRISEEWTADFAPPPIGPQHPPRAENIMGGLWRPLLLLRSKDRIKYAGDKRNCTVCSPKLRKFQNKPLCRALKKYSKAATGCAVLNALHCGVCLIGSSATAVPGLENQGF